MPKRDRGQQRLDALRAAEEIGGEAALRVVEEALTDRAGPIVARAAEVAERLGLAAAGPALVRAAARWQEASAKSDPGCFTRLALVRAIRLLQFEARDLLRQMLTVRQLEYTPDRFIDVAIPLRAEAALAIGASGDPLAPALLTDLLFDGPPDEPAVRIAAARGLGATGYDGAAYALRAKLASDAHDASSVLGECCGAIAQLDPPWGEQYVIDFLSRHPEAAPAAALAVGESRCPSAAAILRAAWPTAQTEAAVEAILLAWALTRLPEGVEFLLDQLATAPPATAKAARQALRLYERDDAIAARIESALNQRQVDGPRTSFSRQGAP